MTVRVVTVGRRRLAVGIAIVRMLVAVSITVRVAVAVRVTVALMAVAAFIARVLLHLAAGKPTMRRMLVRPVIARPVMTMHVARRGIRTVAQGIALPGTGVVFHRSSRGRSDIGSATCSSMSASIPLICRSAAT